MGADRARTTILVTGAAGPAGRALGAQLAAVAPEHRPNAVGVDLRPRPVTGFDEVLAAPAADDPGYDRLMLDLVVRLDADLVVPTVSEELTRIAVLGLSAGLDPRRLVVSSPGSTAVAGDKLLTMWTLARCGVPVPRHATPGELGSAAAALTWGGGPVVVKPRVSRGGRGVHVLEHAADPVWDELDESWIVQEFASGTEYSPQVHRSPATGACRVVVLEKTGRKEGRVGNATSVARLPDGEADDVVDVARRTVEALDLVGPVDMDVRRRDDGTPVVLEVNARFGAVSAHAPELLDAVLRERTGRAP